jgi:energy-coupling factor transporter ATP-binding protein EcfA2
MSQSNQEKVTYIGKVDYRNKELTFGIKEKDRTRHTYIIGKTGMGKSTLLENLAIQDINNGEGLCVIDPHGSMAEKLLDHIPESRIKDVVYFAPFDSEYPLGLNVLEKVDADKRHLVANGLMSAFKKVFGEDRFSDRIQYILNNIILALLENEDQSLLGVNRILTDKEYRKKIVSNIQDPSVKSFWEEEFVKAGDKYQQEAAPGIQNKIGQFIANPLIRNIIGQSRTSFDVRKIMDEKKILIVNLSKGKVGEGNANLIGSLLITKIYLAAMSRADVGPYELEKLPPFYFYVDEFQNFANESFASILSEARKYNLALTVAHQYVEQMTDEVKAAVFGNVGTMIVFRVGATDAEAFEKEFAPVFTLDDIVNLSAYQIYLRLMIDGQGSKPFSARTLNQIAKPPHSSAQVIITHSRTHYGKQKFLVEEEIMEFYKPVNKVEKKKEFSDERGERTIEVNVGDRNTVVHERPPVKREWERRDPPKERREYKSEERSIPPVREDRDRFNTNQQPKKPQYPPREAREQREYREHKDTKEQKPQSFDERPAKSLKEALEEAMRAQKEVRKEDVSHDKGNQTSAHPTPSEPTPSPKKEIDEKVLRSLLEE